MASTQEITKEHYLLWFILGQQDFSSQFPDKKEEKSCILIAILEQINKKM
jgi:hypothetical protein